MATIPTSNELQRILAAIIDAAHEPDLPDPPVAAAGTIEIQIRIRIYPGKPPQVYVTQTSVP